jgi:DNA-binding transcriptional LysR family regulator
MWLHETQDAAKHGMNYRQLEAFRAVMEAGTVTGASALLRISQPSLSAHIVNLEHSLQLKLFIRRAGRLVPTAEAELLFGEVNKVVKGMTRLRHLASDIRQLSAGRLVVAAYPALSSAVLPSFAADFARRHTEASLALIPSSSVHVGELAGSRQVDIGFTAMPIADTAVSCELLARSPSVCVLPLDHPLSSQETIEAAQLADESFIALGREDGARQSVERAMDEAGVSVAVRFEAHYSDTACALVAESMGVSVVDPFAASRWEGRIAIRAFVPPVPCDVYLVRNRSDVPSLLQQAFVDEFRTSLEGRFQIS